MKKKRGCIVFLVRSSKEDLEMLNESLALVGVNLLPAIHDQIDILLFHEKSFDQKKKDMVRPIKNADFVFQEIEFVLPDYQPEIVRRIPQLFPHPTHDHPGFSMGYRHMCDFFAGTIYSLPIMQNYEYYLRLDTDSYILSPVRYDVFDWMKKTGCEYGFIEEALQQDHPKVTEGLWKDTKKWLETNAIQTQVSIDTLPESRMFYTNFELGKVAAFSPGSAYYSFYEFIRGTGNIFIRRWGDAPIKYLGVNLFIKPEAVQAVRGFRYQHGAIFDLQGYRPPFSWKTIPRWIFRFLNI